MNNILLTNILITLILYLNEKKLVSSDVFTSTNHMKKLLKVEDILLFSINQYIDRKIDQLTYSEK